MQSNLYKQILRYSKQQKFDIEKVQKSFLVAEKLHKGQMRKSGEPYITHPLTVALYLSKFNADEDSIISALLHDTVEDTDITLEDIENDFGGKIAKIINILSKKDFWKTSYCKMKSNIDEMENEWREFPEAIFIKMADRLHNIRTLNTFPVEKQKKKLKETREILLPAFERQVNNLSLDNDFKCKAFLNLLKHETMLKEKKVGQFQPAVLKNKKTEHLAIIKYEGWEGIEQVYLEILNEAAITGKDIYALESNADKTGMDDKFLVEYIKQRTAHGITAYVISPSSNEDKEYKQVYGGKFTKTKTLPIDIDANVNIVGDLVMTFTTNPPQGTLRRSASEANTWRNFIKLRWEES